MRVSLAYALTNSSSEQRTGNSSLAASKLGASTTSRITAQKNLMLASSIARKIDGQRPAIGQIDSLMKAQQAREKVSRARVELTVAVIKLLTSANQSVGGQLGCKSRGETGSPRSA